MFFYKQLNNYSYDCTHQAVNYLMENDLIKNAENFLQLNFTVLNIKLMH